MQKLKIISSISVILLFLCSVDLSAQGKESATNNGQDFRKQLAVFFDFEVKKGPEKSGNKINKAFSKYFSKMEYVSIIPDSDLINENNEKTKCNKIKLGLEFGDLLKADKVLIGTLERSSEKYTEALGAAGANKYIMQIKYKYFYDIKINIIDVFKKKSIAIVNYSFQEKNTSSAMKIIMKKLSPYFQKINLEKEKEEIRKIEEIYIKSDNYYFLVGYSFLFPLQKFSNTISYGHGANYHLGARHLFFKDSSFGFMGSYHYASAKKDYIISYSLLSFGITAGYSFNLSENFRITPFLKGGYLVHLTSNEETYVIVGQDDNRGGVVPYFDPFAAFQLEFAYNFYHDFHFFISAEYTYYLESSGAGMFSSFNGGIKIHF